MLSKRQESKLNERQIEERVEYLTSNLKFRSDVIAEMTKD